MTPIQPTKLSLYHEKVFVDVFFFFGGGGVWMEKLLKKIASKYHVTSGGRVEKYGKIVY